MEPWLSDPDMDLWVGDSLQVLRQLPDQSVNCCLTSPPYWGLRDYGTGEWAGGDPDCDHIAPKRSHAGDGLAKWSADNAKGGGHTAAKVREHQYGTVCGKCGAERLDRQLGLEATPDEYVQNMVAVFREVRRVLRADGTLWLNLGDSFVDKQLQGVPWAVAKALQAPYYTGHIRDERDRIWLAATIEAEGCMFIHKRKVGQYASSYTKADGTESHYHRKNATYGAGLEVASTDRVIVERCMAITGIGSINEQSPEQNERRKQTIYRWNVRSNECRWIIRELYPHFYAKQHEARLLLGCPSSGANAEKAHSSLKAIHNGQTPDIDFAPPEPMWEPGWFLRSDVIWAKPQPDAGVSQRPPYEGARVRVPAHTLGPLLLRRRRDQGACRVEPLGRPDDRPRLEPERLDSGEDEEGADLGGTQRNG